LDEFWVTRLDLSEGYDWTERMLSGSASNVPTAARVRAITVAGRLAWLRRGCFGWNRGWWDERVPNWLNEGIELSTELGDRRLQAHAVLNRGLVARFLGDRIASDRLLQRSLDLFRECG